MNLDNVITSRRSIRKYKNQKVERNVIEQLIQSAIMAPTWKNSQTARYYIVESEEMLAEVKSDCLPEFNANNCKDAPVLIVTTFIKNRSGYERNGEASNELGNHWGAYDLGLHSQNLLLKATDLGLGTLVMGIRDAEKIHDVLEIPKEQEIVSIIAVGYPDIAPEAPKRKTVEDIVVYK
ncbi:MAG: nitroreductase family protein [Coprobacillaceae bacterium]